MIARLLSHRFDATEATGKLLNLLAVGHEHRTEPASLLLLRVAVGAFARVRAILSGNDGARLAVIAGDTAVDLRSRSRHFRPTPGAGNADEDIYSSPAWRAAGGAAAGDPVRKAFGGGGDNGAA